jgi:hypothetical protein
MKFFCYFIFIISLNAFSKELPKRICTNNLCGIKGEKIWNEMKSQGIGLQKLIQPSVITGECHWQGNYRPNDTHHMGMLLDFINHEMTLNGVFSFYAKENPYSDLGITEARSRWQAPQRKLEFFAHYPTHSFIDKNPNSDRDGESPVWYWLSQNSLNLEEIYLVVFFGRNHLGICKGNLNF